MPKHYAELVELKETSDALKEGAIQEDGFRKCIFSVHEEVGRSYG